MTTHLLAVVVGIPLAWHLGLAAYAYHDAGRQGMDRRRWAAVALLVPLFGFFAYVFERGEQDYDPAEDPYAGGGYNLHESGEGGDGDGRGGGAGANGKRRGDGDDRGDGRRDGGDRAS